MSFVCPGCDRNSLQISFFLELPPSVDDDEIAVQVLQCEDCGFRGLAVYRESRHGSLDSESWQHSGYMIGDEDMERLMQAMRKCPSPADRRCACQAHVLLGKYDWSAVAQSGIEVIRTFEMRLAP